MFKKFKIMLSAHKQVLKLVRRKKINLADYRSHYARILILANDFEFSTSKYIADNLCELSQEKFEYRFKEWQEALDLKHSEAKWRELYFSDKQFFNEYADFKYECTPELVAKRNEAYRQRYNIPDDCYIGHHCTFRCSHYIPNNTSKLEFGHKVSLAENVFIDYTGHVIIDDGVVMANGVVIESHYRDLSAWKEGQDINIPTEVHIENGVYIGSRALILATCHTIGTGAVIAANAVVTKDVPANCLVAGVPAKVIKYYDK